MRTSVRLGTLGVIGLLICPTTAVGQVTVEYQWGGEVINDFSDLDRGPVFGDLIDLKEPGNGGFFEGGFVDPANNVEAFNFNFMGCLEQWDGIEDPIVDPLDCFWHGYGDPGGCDPSNHMLDFTEGTWLVAPILRDFARAAGVFRYDFDTPTDVGEILLFTKNEGKDVRVFQHYDVYVSFDDTTEGMTPLALGVTNGIFGASTNPGTYSASYTHIFDCSGAPLATGVTKIRFVVYPSGLGDLFMDPWRGYWHPDNGQAWLNCEDQYPAEPGDVDGRQKPFAAPMIAEIDVLPPQPAPALGDGDNDGDTDLDDFVLFSECMTAPAAQGIPYDCRAFNFDGDCDVDLADFGGLQELF